MYRASYYCSWNVAGTRPAAILARAASSDRCEYGVQPPHRPRLCCVVLPPTCCCHHHASSPVIGTHARDLRFCPAASEASVLACCCIPTAQHSFSPTHSLALTLHRLLVCVLRSACLSPPRYSFPSCPISPPNPTLLALLHICGTVTFLSFRLFSRLDLLQLPADSTRLL